MSTCNKCNTIIEKGNEPTHSVKCLICENMFHPNCVNLTKTFLKNIIVHKNFFWVCNDCLNVKHFQTRVMQQFSDLERLIKAQEVSLKNYTDQRIDEVKKMANAGNTRVISPIPVQSTITSAQQRNCNGTPTMKRRWNDIARECSDSTPKDNVVVDTAKRVKQSILSVNKNSEHVLIVKSKSDENKARVTDAVKGAINPLTDPVKRLRQTAKGDVVIHCKDKLAADKIKEKLETKVGTLYDINEPKTSTPLIKIVGFEEEYVPVKKVESTVDADVSKMDDDGNNNESDKQSVVSESDEQIVEIDSVITEEDLLIKALRVQNCKIFDSSSTIVIKECNKLKNRETYYATIEVDINTFKKAIASKTVTIGWKPCRVYEHVTVLRCYKCNDFGHKAGDCRNPSHICALCAESHKIEECKATTYKCINCIRARNELNIDIDVNHAAFSNSCPVLSRKIEQRKKFIRYES